MILSLHRSMVAPHAAITRRNLAKHIVMNMFLGHERQDRRTTEAATPKAKQLKTKSTPNDLSSLEALVERAGKPGKSLPPVEKWEPESRGELDIVIKGDGAWFYMGTPIRRMPLVKLFSTVLRKDPDGTTYLVTPVEKIAITVEDAHFVAVEANVHHRDEEQIITFRTNVGDVVEAGPDHPLRFEIADNNQGVKPYILVRGRLEALMARPVMLEVISHGEEIEIDGQNMFAIRSNGAAFAVMPVDELERQVEAL